MIGAPRLAPDVPCPPLHVLLALPGAVSLEPTAYAVIPIDELPHWLTWEGYGWMVLGRDPSEEDAWDRWQDAHRPA